MADVIHFGQGMQMFGPAAMMRAIFRYARDQRLDDPELTRLLSREDEFDVQGGWLLDGLSLPTLQRLNEMVLKFAKELPTGIADWPEPYRPKFYCYFEEFKEKLRERIEQLEKAA